MNQENKNFEFRARIGVEVQKFNFVVSNER